MTVYVRSFNGLIKLELTWTQSDPYKDRGDPCCGSLSFVEVVQKLHVEHTKWIRHSVSWKQKNYHLVNMRTAAAFRAILHLPVIFKLGSTESRSRVIRYKHSPLPHSLVRSSETPIISLVLLLASVTASNIKDFLHQKTENFPNLYGLRKNWKIDNFVVSLVTSIRAGRSGVRLSVGEGDFSPLKRPKMHWSPHSYPFKWHRVYFLRVEQMAREVDLSHPSSAKTEDERRHTSTPSPACNGVDSDIFTGFMSVKILWMSCDMFAALWLILQRCQYLRLLNES